MFTYIKIHFLGIYREYEIKVYRRVIGILYVENYALPVMAILPRSAIISSKLLYGMDYLQVIVEWAYINSRLYIIKYVL